MEIIIDCKKCKKKVTKYSNDFSREFLKHHAWHINYQCGDCADIIKKDSIVELKLNDQDK